MLEMLHEEGVLPEREMAARASQIALMKVACMKSSVGARVLLARATAEGDPVASFRYRR